MPISTYRICLYFRRRRQWCRRGSYVGSYKTNHGYEQEGDQAWNTYILLLFWSDHGQSILIQVGPSVVGRSNDCCLSSSERDNNNSGSGIASLCFWLMTFYRTFLLVFCSSNSYYNLYKLEIKYIVYDLEHCQIQIIY
jgi:hypothetical protein